MARLKLRKYYRILTDRKTRSNILRDFYLEIAEVVHDCNTAWAMQWTNPGALSILAKHTAPHALKFAGEHSGFIVSLWRCKTVKTTIIC